jgi:CheY-like chemotaxis protein
MSAAGDRDRTAALGLVGALALVLADVAGADAVHGARAAAQALGLPGLERLLEECAPLAGLAWPAEVLPALGRVRRLAAQTAESGELVAFRTADHELAALADGIAAPRRGTARPAGGVAAATLGLAEALEDLPLADDASREVARRARVAPPVAAALRAALEWLAGGSARPLALRAEDSLLEVRCEHVEFDGLDAAAEVLAAAGANLGPGLGPSEPWLVRVPLPSDRPIHLMIVSSGVPLAVPWHAVLRLHMATRAELSGRDSLGGWPLVTDPVGGSCTTPAGEVPLALVAHGRKRGWVVAERLVWRLPAERVAGRPADADTPAPPEGLAAMVVTGEGERFWLADPAWLLRGVAAPTLQRSAAPPAPAAPVPPRPAPPAPAAAVPPPSAPAAPAPPRLTLLTPADVQPLAGPAPREARLAAAPGPATPPVVAPAHPLPAPPPGPPPVAPRPAPPAAPEPPARFAAQPHRGPRTALVAEDSITARIFLARLLARHGFDVRTVDTAAALRVELERGGWLLTCVDIELPDEAGTAFLAGLVARHGGGTAFVALVRDADDRSAARRAGIERMLRKPFDVRELDVLLGRLGLPAAGPR